MELLLDTIGSGREIIITVDANEHMVKGKLAKKTQEL